MPIPLAMPPTLPLQRPQLEIVRHLSYERNDHRILLRRIKGSPALFFQSKMSCDVDGSPNAYHPFNDDLALDVIGSAGGKREAERAAGILVVPPSPEVVVYQNGKPYIQPDGEFRGFYLSETSYQNRDLPATDPARYLDARHIQYIVLPGGLVPEAEVGDLAIVYDPWFKNHVAAVFGDIGPSSESGEVALATIQRLGLPVKDGKSSPGQMRDDLFYLVFPHTAEKLAASGPWPHPQATIDALAEAEFVKWGGEAKIQSVLEQDRQGGSLPDVPENHWIYEELVAIEKASLVGPYEFATSGRPGIGGTLRLPCAPEIVVACHAAIGVAQRKIEDVERGKSDVTTLDRMSEHLKILANIVGHFPAEAMDEFGSAANERLRVSALLARIERLRGK